MQHPHSFYLSPYQLATKYAILFEGIVCTLKTGFFCISSYVLLNFKEKTLTLNNNTSTGILGKCILEMYGTFMMNNNIYISTNVLQMLVFRGSKEYYMKAIMLYDKINLLHTQKLDLSLGVAAFCKRAFFKSNTEKM